MAKIAFTAPHYQATQAGLAILEQGGNAVDAMVAAAATVAVAYPHMNSLGGDGFWLVQVPGQAPFALDASGWAAQAADVSLYDGLEAIPARGPKAALTMAGAVSGWQLARHKMVDFGFENLPINQVLQTAMDLAKQGIEVTDSLAAASRLTFETLKEVPGFAACFAPEGRPLVAGERFQNAALGDLLNQLATQGLDDFYRGGIAQKIGAVLSQVGSPITTEDLNAYHAQEMPVLSADTALGTLYNVGAPTQGLASLLILALYDRLVQPDWSEAQQVHHLVECTKQAFLIRDAVITDPSRLTADLQSWLSEAQLQTCLTNISADQALPWPHTPAHGDTVWMGCVDAQGVMVSYIQSIYWEFGSGVVIPEFGLVWNNRGTSFSLDPKSRNALAPRMKPFHTLNPAMCVFKDGRRMVYGTMGGEGQPQTQAAVYSRYAYQHLSLNQAIAEDRWLLGRTWGDQQHDLKMEPTLASRIGQTLQSMGHELQVLPQQTEKMGHAGAVVLFPDGDVSAATDPRSDGAALIIEGGA
ncbi:gamma-glutamyltransferase family protein [Thiosulfativibrio zosterae]|uniref:Gamma-glutamyltransferase n=1 Tax=Thiosulfativibrio zosterae TaxID=2675053 RepID=A0A6F8PP72_9GAMM|nr:gamma-glutamyltransferase [Thiosulfativibrio zosterae]BBP43913.1 gamma-glutamyltransferase [Thiosulfativibrio zosterae]